MSHSGKSFQLAEKREPAQHCFSLEGQRIGVGAIGVMLITDGVLVTVSWQFMGSIPLTEQN